MTIFYGNEAKTEAIANCHLLPALGEQVKVCHTTCPAGEDTRNRMYITNKGGHYLWYCHNCGNGGHWFPKETSSLIDTSSTEISIKKNRWTKLELEDKWYEAEKDVENFSTEARLWLAQYDMLDATIVYNPKENQLYLPLYSAFPDRIYFFGIQARNFSADKPKYTTMAVYNDCGCLYQQHTKDNAPLVIVEDALSAMKINMCGGVGYALLGTSMKEGLPRSITDGRKIILWLDKDVAGSVAAAKLTTYLSPLYPSMITVFYDQPKEAPINVLKEFVDFHTP